MTQTTPTQERYTQFSYPNPQWPYAMVSAQTTSPSGRSQGSTSISHGCAGTACGQEVSQGEDTRIAWSTLPDSGSS